MKNIILSFIILCSITVISSCDYDDSNDIDIIKPNDSTTTATQINTSLHNEIQD
ncbi:hypothetical protein [uncultured Maribacter sp.]|uniref:hypothetical protein n=1 Tax=uncultured Maribacter sp. TaxID=431308 RepID=UPI0030DA7F8A